MTVDKCFLGLLCGACNKADFRGKRHKGAKTLLFYILSKPALEENLNETTVNLSEK